MHKRKLQQVSEHEYSSLPWGAVENRRESISPPGSDVADPASDRDASSDSESESHEQVPRQSYHLAQSDRAVTFDSQPWGNAEPRPATFKQFSAEPWTPPRSAVMEGEDRVWEDIAWALLRLRHHDLGVVR